MPTLSITAGPDGPRLAFPPVLNAASVMIDRHLESGRGDQTAIFYGERRWTYSELAAAVARTGHGLRRLGLERGDRLLMVVRDAPEFFELFWGAIKVGVVPVPVNTFLRADDYRYLIDDSAAAAVVTSSAFAGEVEAALESAGHRPSRVLRGDGRGSFGELFAGEAEELEAISTAPEDDCFWLYSSGSTGRPKGAIHRHRDPIVTSVLYGEKTLGVTANDLCFSASKLFFAYGLGNAMTFPLWAGAAAVLEPQRPTPERTFEVIERFRPTLYFGVPTLYAAQLAALEEHPADLSSVRLCVSAGEALPADVYRRWRERTGLEILDGIGSTEALHIFISNRPGDVRPGTSGRPVLGYRAEVRGDDGAETAAGEPGRLFIRGDSTARVYWNHPEKSARTFLDGWLDTGDTYVRDADGYFVYCGRSDDMFKVSGLWCSPFEIEACLIEHPAVLEAAVVAALDEDGLTKPEAWVVARDGTEGTVPGAELERALATHCQASLAPHQRPRRYRWARELPKTATGKIQRFKLRAGG